jgi:hypothetical protein
LIDRERIAVSNYGRGLSLFDYSGAENVLAVRQLRSLIDAHLNDAPGIHHIKLSPGFGDRCPLASRYLHGWGSGLLGDPNLERREFDGVFIVHRPILLFVGGEEIGFPLMPAILIECISASSDLERVVLTQISDFECAFERQLRGIG